jgi:hypothetical protein
MSGFKPLSTVSGPRGMFEPSKVLDTWLAMFSVILTGDNVHLIGCRTGVDSWEGT